jgi:hypothetical protein
MENQTTIQTVSHVDFNGATAKLNLETLSKSATHLQVSGMLPASRPVHHFQLLEWLQKEMAEITGEETTVEPIYISARHSARIRTDINEVINPKDPCPIEKLNIQRLVTRIGINHSTSLGNDDLNPAVSVGYNERGIEIAYGANVWACSNMNIFGENKYATYGKDKVTFEVLRTVVLNMLKDWKGKFNRDVAVIDAMQNQRISLRKSQQWVGELLEEAIKCTSQFGTASDRKHIINTYQINNLQKELLCKESVDETISVWDFCQAGTEHLKAEGNDLVSLYPAIQSFNNWVLDKASIQY